MSSAVGAGAAAAAAVAVSCVRVSSPRCISVVLGTPTTCLPSDVAIKTVRSLKAAITSSRVMGTGGRCLGRGAGAAFEALSLALS
jgi:hypothetical protein